MVQEKVLNPPITFWIDDGGGRRRRYQSETGHPCLNQLAGWLGL